MSVPCLMVMGVGVRIEKWSQGGVMASRFSAFAKKLKVCSRGRGSSVSCSKTKRLIWEVRSGLSLRWFPEVFEMFAKRIEVLGG